MYFIKLLTGKSFMLFILLLIKLFSLLPKRKEREEGKVIVLTGTFYSKNWINAHLVPLVTSENIKHVFIVSKNIEYDIKGLTVIKPSLFVSKICGNTISRLLSFFTCSLTHKPDYIGGFHILFNAAFAILFAQILRTRSIYFCVGGITETLETGSSENSFFKFIEKKDTTLTDTICKIACSADRIITMGKGAKLFLISKGAIPKTIFVISGAIDKNIFFPAMSDEVKKYDVVLTARLSGIKQVDLFIDVVKAVNLKGTPCSALIIGAGPLLESLKQYTIDIQANNYFTFAGHQESILPWLHQSKINMLTSRSEGLALSLLEGLKAGLPAIVPDVGDLSDVLKNGYNGFLIENHNKDEFVTKIIELLNNPKELSEFSSNAIESTIRFDLKCVQKQWSTVFE